MKTGIVARLGLVTVTAVILSSCVTGGTITKTKDFALDPANPISIQSPNSRVMARLEGDLLGAGFNVVPFETATSAVTTDATVVTDENRRSGTMSTYAATYIPTAIVINVGADFDYYPAATYFRGGFVRIVDLSNKKLLANFTYEGSVFTVGDERDFVRMIMKDLAKITVQ